MTMLPDTPTLKPPDLTQTDDLINQLRLVGSRYDEMKEELKPALESLEETKKEKTGLTDAIRRTLLAETQGYAPTSYYDDLLETYYDDELVISAEGQFIRSIITYADNYLAKTGVDIIGALLSVSIGGIKKRLMESPDEFGFIKSDDDSDVKWSGRGAKIQRNKKVRVSTKI